MNAVSPTCELIFSGRAYYQSHNAVYNLLAHMEPGLVLDIGAASGGVCKLVADASPDSRIIGFEPFPGNWPYLTETVSSIPQATVDHRAASDTNGPGKLYVSAVVTGREKGWEGRVGYSSSGALVNSDDKRYDDSVDVEMVRLDSLYDEKIRFLKIDVQGAEMSVLNGAQGLLEQGLVDFMWVEFTGETEILAFVRSHGFEVFDSQYLIIPRNDPPTSDEWEVTETLDLSNGKVAYLAWPREYPRSDKAYCEWLTAQRSQFIIQTDLTFVHHRFMRKFLTAAGKAAH